MTESHSSTTGRCQLSHQHGNSGSFTSAIVTKEHENLTTEQGQRKVVYSRRAVELLSEIIYLQDIFPRDIINLWAFKQWLHILNILIIPINFRILDEFLLLFSHQIKCLLFSFLYYQRPGLFLLFSLDRMQAVRSGILAAVVGAGYGVVPGEGEFGVEADSEWPHIQKEQPRKHKSAHLHQK